MTWPDLNWELIEAFAYIIGAIIFASAVNYVGAKLGIKGHRSRSLHIFGDDYTRLNPSTGLTMNGPTDAGGSLYGESLFDHHDDGSMFDDQH